MVQDGFESKARENECAGVGGGWNRASAWMLIGQHYKEQADFSVFVR